jgi:hypothetical protein
MGLSVRKVARPLAVAATVCVMLGTGAGTALAATGDGTPHDQTTKAQLCSQGDKEALFAVGTSAIFTGLVFFGGPEFAGESAVTVADAAKLLAEVLKAMRDCPEQGGIPKQPLPPFLRHLKKNPYLNHGFTGTRGGE